MKRYYRILFIILLFYVAGILSLIFIFSDSKIENNDLIVLNDIAMDYIDNIDQPSSLLSNEYGIDYAIFNRNGQIVLSNCNFEYDNFSDLIRNRYVHMSIQKEGQYYGEVVLNENNQTENILLKKTVTALIIVSLVNLIAMIIYGSYVKRTIISPFEKMESFASQIAVGNLDINIPMEKENMFGAFTESFDIMREEIAASQKREIELKKREKELIASLSHDLKTPITGIKLTSELLKVKTEDEYTRDKIDTIYKKADQIDALVNDLFASTLDDLGQMQVNCKDEDSSILKVIVERHDDRKLVKNGALPECLICIDARRMDQIISNIISNSYKYANTKIDIDYSIVGGYLQMSIRDFGPGIGIDEVHLVTNKFYRGKSEEVEMQEGSGLGLYISKILIERMNGEIICSDSAPGFKVNLMIPLS